MIKAHNQHAANDNRNLKTFGVAIFLFILFLSSFALAEFQYSSRGSQDKQYHTENYTLFNSLYAGLYGAPVIYSKTLNTNNMLQPPLIYDINLDGKDELIIASGNDIKIYQNRSLQLLGIYSSGTEIKEYSAYNYDGERYLVYTTGGAASTASNITILKWNAITNQLNWSASINTGLNFASNMLSFACDDVTGRCLAAGANPDVVNAYSFNLSNSKTYTQAITIEARSNVNDIMCFPSIPDITTGDINNDGINEYALSYGEISSIGANVFEVSAAILTVNETNQITTKYDAVLRSPNFNVGSTCASYRFLYTAPLLADVIEGAALDLVIGVNSNSNEFKMYSYRWVGNSLSFYDDHPEIFQADGIIISNPILANIFEDTGINDYCVMGFTTNNATDLLCASDMTSDTPQTRESRTANFTNFFIPQSSTAQNIIHSIQAKTNIENGQDISEILTPFGVYSIESCSIFGNCNLILEYPLTYTDGIASYGRLTDKPYLDLIYTKANNVYVIDDKFINSNAKIDEYTINPCISSVWKQNTTAEISITPRDSDGDAVRARMVLYADSENIQDSGWLGNYSSGTTITASFTAYNKTASGKIYLQAQDIKQPDNSTYDQIILSFAVSDDGVVFGDCQTAVSNIIADSVAANVSIGVADEVSLTSNVLTDWADDTAGTFGLPILLVVLLFFMMIDIIIFIMLHSHPVIALTSILITDFFFLIIFSLIGWIPTALVITLIILIIIGAIIYLSYIFNKGISGGSGG